MDAFVDGSSSETIIGKNTSNGKNLSIDFKITNNSMISAWHIHTHATSNELLYGGLVMPYIIKDEYSKLLDKYFKFNINDILLVFNTIELDKKGYLNSSLVQMYNCIYFKDYKNSLNIIQILK